MLKFKAGVLLVIALALLPAVAGADDVYRVRFDADFSNVSVEACFPDSVPGRLQRSREAGRYVLGLRAGNRQLGSNEGSNRLELPELPPGTCIQWDLDLARAAADLDYRQIMRLDDSLVTRADLWFWQDPKRQPPRVIVSLPPDWSISVPWQKLAASGTEHVFRPEATPASWTSRIAVGRLRSSQIEVPGAGLRLAIVGDVDDMQADTLEAWIEVSARSVAGVFGHFPHPHPQILVITTDPRWRRQKDAVPSAVPSPVPWAHVIRGGGMGAEFYVDPSHGAAEFAADWTATHELSHMLMPYVARDDRWLSEGAASYYQNVLRARDGRLSETEAWQKLHAGFQRGQVNTGNDPGGASRNPGIMRTYWGGAAMMLKADTELRARSQGKQSLDTALAALQACCRDPGRRWTAREMFAQLDRVTGFSVFTNLHREYERTGEFPDLRNTYAQLGLVPGSKRITIDGNAPWGRIRHFIMSAPAGGMNSPPPPGGSHASGGAR